MAKVISLKDTTKWSVSLTFEVSNNWIEDGFDLEEKKLQIKKMFEDSYAYANEVKISNIKVKKV